MYTPVRTAAPGSTPVSVEEAKAHCRVDDTASDDLITALIEAAVSHLDGWTGILGRCLMQQTWRQDFDCFAPCLRLPLYPVSSVTVIQYDDAEGVTQTIDSANYALLDDDRGAYVRFKDSYDFATLYDGGASPPVRVTYVAGYADAASVPAAIKAAIKLMVGAWFENREESIIGVPVAGLTESVAVKALLGPFRRTRV